MSDLNEQIRRLQSEAAALPRGAAKIALLEEAVRHADILQDIRLGYQLRQDLMSAASGGRRPDVVLVAFAWCLAQYDREPGRFNREDLLWKYTWVIGSASSFAEVERQRLEQLLTDMERRYQAAGAGMFSVQQSKRALMMTLRDQAAAREAHAAYRKCRRDSLSDCAACTAFGELVYHTFMKHWRRAIHAARPVLDGRLTCREQPRQTFNKVLLPLFFSGQVEEARRFQELGYRNVGQATHATWELADQLSFSVLVGDLNQAKRMAERHLAAALDTITLSERYDFLLASRLWTDSLLRRGTTRIKVRLPDELPAADARGMRDVAELGHWFTEQAQAIATRFDARNGNDYYRQEIAELPDLLQRALQ